MTIDFGLVFYVFTMVMVPSLFICLIFCLIKILSDCEDKIRDYIRYKRENREYNKDVAENKKRVKAYYEAERKKQNMWKIRRPALALSKEFDKLIRS